MNKLKKFFGLLAHFLYEVSGGWLFDSPPKPVVIKEARIYTGETLQFIRYASLAGGFYRVFLKPNCDGHRPWIGRRAKRQEAVASFARLRERLS